jgi:orotate phosphoribosyltransferase
VTLERELSPLERDLFDRALLRGTFTLRSGRTSDRYFDKYLATTEPELLRAIATRMATVVQGLESAPTLLAAPELGGIPLVTAVGLETGTPFAFIRASGKEYGTARQIEGAVPAGARVVLIEDVVTSGGAAIEAITVVREAGGVVDDCICLLDRGEGGSDAIAAIDVTLHPVVTSEALDQAFASGLGTVTS